MIQTWHQRKTVINMTNFPNPSHTQRDRVSMRTTSMAKNTSPLNNSTSHGLILLTIRRDQKDGRQGKRHQNY